MNNIVIIGGGPVGLYAALKIKTTFPKARITLYEKRQKYTRKQILLITKESSKRFPKILLSELWGKNKKGCYVEIPWLTKSAKCYFESRPELNKSIITSTLEKTIFKMISELDVKIIRKNITVSDLNELSETNDVILGCDGADSTVSKFLKTTVTKNKLSYGLGVNFKYSKRDKGPDIKPLRKPQHRYRGFRSNEGIGYIGINLKKKEYLSYLKGNSLDDIVQDALNFYSFEKVSDIETWSFKVVPYRRKPCVDTVNRSNVFLVGDACIGPHFFTGSGVNNGFMSVNFIVDRFNSKIVKNYENFIKSLSKQNAIRAKTVRLE